MAATGPKIPIFVSAAQDELYLTQGDQMLRMFQALVQPNVIDLTDTPPAAPANGDTYIVAVGATGAWIGHDNDVVYWTTNNPAFPTGTWEFWPPKDGWIAAAQGFAKEASGIWKFDGTEWAFCSFIGERGTGLFDGLGNAITINLPTGYPDANYQVHVTYDYPLVNPGIISIEYVSGTQFKIHSSSATDGSAIRWCSLE